MNILHPHEPVRIENADAAMSITNPDALAIYMVMKGIKEDKDGDDFKCHVSERYGITDERYHAAINYLITKRFVLCEDGTMEGL